MDRQVMDRQGDKPLTTVMIPWTLKQKLLELAPTPAEAIRRLLDQLSLPTEDWNQMVFALSELAKPGDVYEGESWDELWALLKARLSTGEDND